MGTAKKSFTGRDALSLFLMGGLWPGRGTCLYGGGMVLGSVCGRYGTWAAHGGLRAQGLSSQASVGFIGYRWRGEESIMAAFT